jgi:hypothetical protein
VARSTGKAWHHTHPLKQKLLGIADMYQRRVKEITDYLDKKKQTISVCF